MELDRTFLKRLWNGESTVCPKCDGGVLIPLHQKRKDNDNWQCPNCKEVYRTINILRDLLNRGR